jgi:molybdate transport system substrate-binding protein
VKRVSVLAVVSAAALLLAGCGSSGNSNSGSSSSAATTSSADSSAPMSSGDSSAPMTSGDSSTSSAAPSSDTSASSATSESSASSSGGGDTLTGSLTVYAAASLQKTFDQLRTMFQQAHPNVKVNSFNYDGSSTLVTQLTNGAKADVFASADDKNMAKLTDAKLATGPVEFATNTLEIAVAPGNPKNITSLKDLENSALKVVLCAPGVPCGTAAQTAEKAGGVTIKPVSEEQNVTAVLTKVETGIADAGIVYQTDVKGAGSKVTGVNFPEAAKAINNYPIVELSNSANPEVAKAFIAMVTGAEGQKVLQDAGFGRPPTS